MSCTKKRVHLGLGYVQGCPHVRDGLHEGFHYGYMRESYFTN